MICVIQLGRWILFTNHSCLFKRDYSLCRSCVQLRVKSCVSVLILALILLASMLVFFFFPDILLSAFLHQRATPLLSIFYGVSCSYKWKAALTKGIKICPATSAGYYWVHYFLPALWSQISFYSTAYSRNSTPSGQQTFSNASLFSPICCCHRQRHAVLQQAIRIHSSPRFCSSPFARGPQGISCRIKQTLMTASRDQPEQWWRRCV